MAVITSNAGAVLTAVDGRILVTADHVFPVDLGVITDPKTYRLTPVYRATVWRARHSVLRLTPRYKVEDL